MICKICGANNPDGAQFCDDCGAPLIEYSQPQTETVEQQINKPQPEAGQSQLQQSQLQQLEQQRLKQQQRQQQMENQLQQQQQQRQQQMENQLQQQQNVQAVHPSRPQMTTQQQPMQPQQQAMQSQITPQRPMQPQQPMQSQITPQRPMQPQQPMQSQFSAQRPMQPQQTYESQTGAYNNAKKGKSSSSKGPLIFLVVFILLAALAAVFIIFVIPKLSKGEPKGKYGNNDFGGYILFDDGVYAVYDTTTGYEFGTYEVKGDRITFTSVNGETDYGKYNKKADTVEYGYLFESSDSKGSFDVDIDKSYVTGLKDKIKEAAESVCADDEILTEADVLGGPYYIYGDELSDGHTAFSRALSDKLGYNSDKVLSYLLENNFITFEVTVNTSNKTVELTIY